MRTVSAATRAAILFTGSSNDSPNRTPTASVDASFTTWTFSGSGLSATLRIVTGTSRRRWTDAAIESELRARCAELGHFPTRAELVASGLRGLWDAIRSTDGVEAWRTRVQAGQPASQEEITAGQPASQEEITAGQPASQEEITAGQPASQEEITARAYELYQSGAAGDAVDHWLAAERELTPK
jgi:hypothetical protein